MKLRYAYHSEHNADKQDRWIHFVLFVGALLLLLAASQQLFLHFTAWHAADEAHNWNHLILGIVYLLIAGPLTFIGLRLKNNSQGDADRYVRIGEPKGNGEPSRVGRYCKLQSAKRSRPRTYVERRQFSCFTDLFDC
jgi:hypothetical protein